MTDTPSPTASLNPQASLLERVRHLVESKTRFEPQDITARGEEKTEQPYTIKVAYGLFSTLVSASINGNFKPGNGDQQHPNGAVLKASALAEGGQRMALAVDQLKVDLGPQTVAYNALSDGTYLRAARQHFHLPHCVDCDGAGKNLCHTCRGSCSETCPDCAGAGTVRCTKYGCMNGKTDCTYCYGSGKVSEYITEYVQVQYEVQRPDGSFSHYGSRTEPVSRNVQVDCRYYECHHGKVTCAVCKGTSRVLCGLCRASGSIVCRTCTGAGYLRCQPCSGTGRLGQALRLEIGLGLTYTLLMPQGAAADAQKIASLEGTHGLPQVSRAVQRSSLAFGPSGAETVYACAFAVQRLDADCNAHAYRVVAYGEDGRWLTLDNIIEDLLRSDLDALLQALQRIQGEGIFATDTDFLLLPLSNVTSSEINVDVVDLVLKSEAQSVAAGQSAVPAGPRTASSQMVSAEYTEEIRRGVLGSLEHVYTRSAKPLSLNLLVVSMVFAIAVAWFKGNAPAALLTLCLIPLTHVLFRRAVRKKLIKAMSSPENAARAIAIAIAKGAHRKAMLLLFVPICVGIPLGLYLLQLARQLLMGHGQ